jgi:hypothetical protein
MIMKGLIVCLSVVSAICSAGVAGYEYGTHENKSEPTYLPVETVPIAPFDSVPKYVTDPHDIAQSVPCKRFYVTDANGEVKEIHLCSPDFAGIKYQPNDTVSQ